LPLTLILALAAERQAIAENSRIASEIATLTAANANLAAVNQTADARIVELTAIVKMLERTLYGTRSERLRSDTPTDEQIAFVFDEIATGMAAIEAELAKAGGQDKPKRAPRPRKEFGAHLERVEIVVEPEVAPGCEGLEKVLIGEDVSKRLDVTPRQVPPDCNAPPEIGVAQPRWCGSGASAAASDRERPSDRSASRPYRGGQIRRRAAALPAGSDLRACDVDLDRSLISQWMGKVGFELQPLADYVLEKIKQGERVFADETTLPTLAPRSGKTQKAWLWACARDDRPFGGIGPPTVASRFEDSRGGECVERHLMGFAGILQVDGYAAYNRLARSAGANEELTLAAYFAHVRRRFYELHVNESSRLATQTVTTMAGAMGDR
jgi:transposase